MASGASVTLSSGHKIPQLGYGTWQSAPGEVGAGIYEALKAGYRHLDLAWIYGNQKEVAEGMKKAFAEIPGLKREDLFITSKLWNHRHRPEVVEAALDDTLVELGLDYLDLYLVHWPVAFPNAATKSVRDEKNPGDVVLDNGVTLSQTWKAMTQLPKSKARTIGVSNFTIEHLDTIIADVGEVPAVLQIERHPLLPQMDLMDYCAKKNIHVTAYSAFGNNNRGFPLLVQNPEIKAVAERLGATPAQVILAWSKLDGHSVIPKSVTASRIVENFGEVKLDEEAINTVNKIGEKPMRYNVPYTYVDPRWPINVWNDKEEMEAPGKVILKL